MKKEVIHRFQLFLRSINTNIPLPQVIQCEDLPLVAVQVKRATLEGAFTFQILFQGKEQLPLAVRTL